MNKLLKIFALLLCGMVIGGAFVGLTDIEDAFGSDFSSESSPLDEGSLLNCSYRILGLLKTRDYTGLSEWVHKEKGLLFAPYSTISPGENQVFLPAIVKNFGNDNTIYIWGITDGVGKPIKMTGGEYFNRFVYDADFLNALNIGINTINRYGNALENVAEIYTSAQFVEFHFSGSEELEGMDWKSLKLVFEKSGGKFYLTAIIHSEWTV